MHISTKREKTLTLGCGTKQECFWFSTKYNDLRQVHLWASVSSFRQKHIQIQTPCGIHEFEMRWYQPKPPGVLQGSQRLTSRPCCSMPFPAPLHCSHHTGEATRATLLTGPGEESRDGIRILHKIWHCRLGKYVFSSFELQTSFGQVLWANICYRLLEFIYPPRFSCSESSWGLLTINFLIKHIFKCSWFFLYNTSSTYSPHIISIIPLQLFSTKNQEWHLKGENVGMKMMK